MPWEHEQQEPQCQMQACIFKIVKKKQIFSGVLINSRGIICERLELKSQGGSEIPVAKYVTV